MIKFTKKLVKKAFNLVGLDVIKSSMNPKDSLLGIRNFSINTIIDIGANTGQFAKEILKIFPHARILLFEPLPTAFKELREWASNKEVNARLFNVALGEIEGSIEMFYHVDHSPSSSLLKTTNKNERLYPFVKRQVPVSIRLTTLDKIISESHELLDYDILIKIDTQGYEDRVIKGGTNTFRCAKACMLEINIDLLYEGQAEFVVLVNLLHELGFRYAGNLDQIYAKDGHVIFLDAIFIK